MALVSCVKIKDKQEGIVYKGDYSQEDMSFFKGFFNEITEAARNKDTKKSFSFYSKSFMKEQGVMIFTIKKNIDYLYENYDDINYKMNNINLMIDKDKALSTDDFEYTARPVKEGMPELEYQGKERIYWKKEGNQWKIVQWVTDLE